MIEENLLNSLSTGVVLIKLDSKVLVEEINLAATEILGLDKKAINTGDLKTSHPNLAKILGEIKERKLDFNDKPKKRIRKELFANGNYLNLFATKINEQEILIEIYKIIQKDIGKTTHELKRPIQNIKSLAEALLMGAKDDPKNAERFLKNINYEANRLGRLVNDLLRLSSLQSGSVEIKKEDINLSAATEEILSSLESSIEEKKIKIENKLDKSLTINADKSLFTHALENIIENAIKYNKENGKVIIENKDNEIIISDTGTGIEEEDLEKIFEQFFRSKRTQNIAGTGLGLSIVKSITELHGWNLSVMSKPETGSSFKISLS